MPGTEEKGEVMEDRPFDAFDGGAKVLCAIKEVLRYGGSVERAVKAGERALSDSRPRTTDLGHSISTNPPKELQ
jgi:hypothetical protein